MLMQHRNLSPQEMFFRLALENKPKYAFASESSAGFPVWKRNALPEVIACLGDFPEKVPLDPEMMAEWVEDGLLKQRWMINVGKHISAAFRINMPLGIKDGERLPGLLCWHGHGSFGKETVMGNSSSPGLVSEMKLYNYDYGHQMAKRGYVTYAIDWIGVGERNDSAKPHFMTHNGGRDWCNIYYLHATMLGMTSISINVAHGMAATDFACEFAHVDPDRLGVMGLSGGGTMTLWTSLCDDRFKASEIICYSDLWQYFGIHDLNYCGMQIAPGLFKLVNLPDLQGLLAPKPLLVDIGIYDTCFKIDNSMECFRQLEKIYAAAGASEMLESDIFPGEHAWGGNTSEAFFGKHLGG